MSFLSRCRCFVGIELTEDGYKITALEPHQNFWKVVDVKEVSLDHPNPLEVLNIEKGCDLVISAAVAAKHLLTRFLSLPLVRNKDIEAALGFQAEALLPYPLEEAVLVHEKKNQLEDSCDLLVYSVKKKAIKEHLEQLAAFDVDHVTTSAHALHMLHFVKQNEASDYVLIYSNQEKGTCVVIENHLLVASYTFAMQETEFKIILASLLKTHDSIETVFLLGDASHTFLDEISKQYFTKVEPLRPHPDLGIADHLFEKFGLSLGMGLSGALGQNFFQESYSSKKQWKRYKKPLLTSIALGALLCVGQFGLQTLMLKNQKAKTEKALEDLASLKQSPMVAGKDFESLEAQIHDLEKQDYKLRSQFPLIPQSPKILDVLAFLSTHPSLVDAQGNRLVEVVNFNYQYEKLPSLSHKKDSVLVKVEFAFTTDQPHIAHNFYESLLKPTPLIQSQKPIDWKSDKNIYRVSFYLKDKTVYEPA